MYDSPEEGSPLSIQVSRMIHRSGLIVRFRLTATCSGRTSATLDCFSSTLQSISQYRECTLTVVTLLRRDDFQKSRFLHHVCELKIFRGRPLESIAEPWIRFRGQGTGSGIQEQVPNPGPGVKESAPVLIS